MTIPATRGDLAAGVPGLRIEERMAAGPAERARASLPVMAIAPRGSSVISASRNMATRATTRIMGARASAGRIANRGSISRTRMKATAKDRATGSGTPAGATGVKAPVEVRALAEAAPGGRSDPGTRARRDRAAKARAGKAEAAWATRLPEAGWPGHTVAVVHRAMSEATPGSRRMSASI